MIFIGAPVWRKIAVFSVFLLIFIFFVALLDSFGVVDNFFMKIIRVLGWFGGLFLLIVFFGLSLTFLVVIQNTGKYIGF